MEGGGGTTNFLKKTTLKIMHMPGSPFRMDQNVIDNEPKCFIMLFNDCINAMEITTVTRTGKRGRVV